MSYVFTLRRYCLDLPATRVGLTGREKAMAPKRLRPNITLGVVSGKTVCNYF
ncbi:hypothetical protein ALP67_200075 [Pseudomonas ficuserectae]|nr:hypothetical protein ALP67_200075 [Pseudomonas ficuserectae]